MTKIKIYFVFLLLNIQCHSIQLSEKITNYYNNDLNGEVLRTLGQGRIHWQMKYLLDTIIGSKFIKSNHDTAYCLFDFNDFSYTGIAYYIDNDDSIFYSLTELNISGTNRGNLLARFKINDYICSKRYKISMQRLNTNQISNNCDFRDFFLKKPCCIETLGYVEGPSINTILKIWKSRNGKVSFEFFERYGTSYPKEPMRKYTSQGLDSVSKVVKKIRFLN